MFTSTHYKFVLYMKMHIIHKYNCINTQKKMKNIKKENRKKIYPHTDTFV